MEWYHYIAAMLNPSYLLPDFKVGQMYTEVAGNTMAGNFLNFILCNITLGQKASLLWAVNAGRFFQTAGLFLLGSYIGRRRLFVSSGQNSRFWIKWHKWTWIGTDK